MKITATNFLGIESASIPLADVPVAVFGPNCSGKTSMATAVAAILTHTANPLGFSATKSPYMHRGADYGEIVLTDDAGQELIRWVLAEKELRVFAEAPASLGLHATSLCDFISLQPAKRVDLWEEVFLPDPSELTEMITKELRQRIARENVLEDVLKTLRLHSWKAAAEQYNGAALSAERAWSKIAGEKFGSAKAKKWVPSDWRSEFAGVTVLEAERNVEDSREALRTVHVKQAITESQAAESESALKKVGEIKEVFSGMERAVADAESAMKAAKIPFDALMEKGRRARQEHDVHLGMKPTAEKSTPCPGCGCPLIVSKDFTLSKASDQEALNRKIGVWAIGEKKLSQNLEALRSKFDAMDDSKLLDCENRFRVLSEEKNTLFNDLTYQQSRAKSGAGTVVSAEYEARLALAEQQIEENKKASKAIEDKHKADDLFRSSLDYRGIASALGPEGIRGQAMKNGLAELDRRLSEIAAKSGWEKPALDRAYAVMYGDSYAVLCSSSEAWRTQFMLRAALAIVTGGNRILADGADILLGPEHAKFVLLTDWLSSEYGVNTIVFQATAGRLHPFPVRWEQVRLESGKGE